MCYIIGKKRADHWQFHNVQPKVQKSSKEGKNVARKKMFCLKTYLICSLKFKNPYFY